MDYSSFVGIPFEKANCYELIRLVLGSELPSYPIKDTEIEAIHENFLKVIHTEFTPVREPKSGDIVAMSTLSHHPNIINHFGLYIGRGRMLQTLRSVNSHIIRLDDYRVASTIKGYYRWSK